MKTVRLIFVLTLFFNVLQAQQQILSFQTSDGESLSYTKTGNGTVIVLLFLEVLVMAQVHFNNGLIPYQRILNAFYLSQRGIGLSGNVKLDSTTINIKRAVLDIEDLRKHLGKEQISLCGISWGGGLAQAYVSYFPDKAKKVVLISSMGPDLTFLTAMNDNKTMRLYPNKRDSILYWSKQPPSPTSQFKLLCFSQLPYFYDHKH